MAAGTLSDQLTDARAKLRIMLLAGESTAGVRRHIAVLERAAAAEAHAKVAAEAELEQREASAIEAFAMQLADGAAVRLTAMIAELQPPPMPEGVRP